jgi:prevent-host-death family protein
MDRKWQMQDAKAKFAEVVRRAGSEGPQIVTYRGADTAVVLSIDQYRKLEGAQPNFRDHLLNGPKLDDDIIDFINERSKDTGRDIDL